MIPGRYIEKIRSMPRRVAALVVCLVVAGAGAFAQEPEAPEDKKTEDKDKKSGEDLEDEWVLQEDADYPDLVGVDDQSAVMD